MSTTLEMTSPSSGIVVVDKSGSTSSLAENGNLIQGASVQHIQQAQLQQVIVNEEYLSAENIVGGNYLKANDLINNAQIIQFVSEEPTASQQRQQDEVYGTVMPTGITNPNSKVHVISNVTLVSKAPQSQTISFVNSKHMASAGGANNTIGGNFVNTYITSKGAGATLQNSNKMVNIPFKTNMSHIQQAQQGQQQQHIITKHLNSNSAIVQKIPIPRNIHLLSTGRVQQQQHQHHQTLPHTQTSRPAVQPTSLNSVIQVQKQPSSQTVSIGKTNVSINSVKNPKLNQTVKLVSQTTPINSKHNVKTVAAPQPTHIAQQKGLTKGSKLIKHHHNNNNAAAMASSSFGGSALAGNQTIAQPQAGHKNVHVHNNFINNNNNNNNNTKMVQSTGPQRPIANMNNVYIQGSVQKVGKSNKYLVQQNQISHIILPPQQQQPQQASQHGTQKLSTTAHAHQYQTQQQHPPQSQQYHPQSPAGGGGGGASGTIKYVNAHGNVIPPPSNHRYRTILQQSLTPSQQQSPPSGGVQQMYTTDHIQSDYQANQQTHHQSPTKQSTISTGGSVDDIIMVNGTHMSEEMSARILQSLSQKSIYNNNNNRNYNSHHTTSLPTPQPQAVPVQQQTNHHYSKQKGHQTQRVYLTSNANDFASQPYHQPPQHTIEQTNKNGPEYFRVNTSDIQSTTSTFIDNIPLISTRGDDSMQYQQHQQNQNDQDDDIIGEEVRPSPIDTSMDVRMQALHALLQDHTYVQMPNKLTAVAAAAAAAASSASIPLSTSTTLTTAVIDTPPVAPIVASGTSKTMAEATSGLSNSASQTIASVAAGAGTISAVGVSSVVPHAAKNNAIGTSVTYPYGIASIEKDDDTHSIISNGSRSNLDLDLGEETETAPEGEGEDDSVTRCICELTHDDGYMICCDKCSVWQHVDCMGIDRLNIPEEYKCELCQPRQVDHNRARTLQLMKRKEQQSFMLINNVNPSLPLDPNLPQVVNSADRPQLNTFSTIAANKKKGTLSSKNRKTDDRLNSTSSNSRKRKRSESSGRANGKRRESKKQSKRKTSTSTNSSSTTKQQTPPDNGTEKQTTSLRSWIENYESAMTNHYSPELRARLHSIGKSYSHVSSLKNSGPLDGKCTTVPHAGGKILISTLEILPSNPVIEVRGKYMLSAQYKALQASQPAPNTRNPANRNPGPFLFFYRLPNDGPEICVDTRTYGNEARFVRRSCRPNAEIVHSIEKGTLHLYIVSLSTIKSSTEITIKHEPHDMEALSRSEITAPSSTICACGLIKDCLFGSPPTTAILNNTPPPIKKLPKRANGHIKEKPSLSSKRKKSTPQSNRNRSTSSSGESSIGMLSPTTTSNAIPPSINSTSAPLHDVEAPAITTPPSVTVTSPARPSTLTVNVPLESPQADLVSLPPPLPPLQPVSQASYTQPKVLPVLTEHLAVAPKQVASPTATSPAPRPATPVESPVVSKPESPVTVVLSNNNSQDVPDGAASTQKDVETKPPPPSPPASPPRSSISQTTEEKNPTVAPQITSPRPLTPPPAPTVSHAVKSPSVSRSNSSSNYKKTPRKSTHSQSEDSSSMAGDEAATVNALASVKKDKDTRKTVESKKLTREERKMEAIVRAFEKMEKTEQRKNEQKQHKSTTSTPTSSSSVATTRKRLISSSFKDKDDGDKTPTKKSSSQMGRRKRKRGKSYSQSNHRPKRRNRLDSHNSEIGTSEDSTTPMVSPTLPPPTSQYDYPKESKHHSQLASSDVGSAAGMLLSLSSYSQKNAEDNILTSPERCTRSLSDKSTPSTPPFPISSACLLIEAAVGPLDKDFKLPTKAKTKKTIMNDWLHQSDGVIYSSASSSQQLNLDHGDRSQLTTKRKTSREESQQSYTKSIANLDQMELGSGGCAIGDYAPISYQDEPQNLSMAAKKIEEFIHLTTGAGSYDLAEHHHNQNHLHRQNIDDDDESIKWHSMHMGINSSEPQTVPTPLPTPPMQLGSSVKKRWLRQAISEECSDELSGAVSAASSPPNGFTAPLKKRRVVRECSDLTTDSIPSPVLNNVFDSPGAEKSSDFMQADRRDEYGNMDTPSPSQSNVLHNYDQSEMQDDITDYDVHVKIEEFKEENHLYADEEDVLAELKTESECNDTEIPSDAVENIEERFEMKEETSEFDEMEEIEDVEPEAEDHENVENFKNMEQIESVQNIEKVEKVEDVDEFKIFEPKYDVVLVDETASSSFEFPIKAPKEEEPVEVNDVKADILLKKIEVDEKPKPIATEFKDEFDIKPRSPIPEAVKVEDNWNLKSESDNLSLESGSIAKDEIEDIQQKLLSFHSENLMILQSRNKKRASRATTPTFVEEPKDALTPTPDTPKNSWSFDETSPELKREDATLSTEEIPSPDKPAPYSNHMVQPLLNTTTMIPPFNQSPMLANPPYSNYMLNSSVRADAGQLMPTQMYPPPTMAPPNFAGIHAQMPNANVPSNNSLYHYLENPNRTSNYNTLGGYVSQTTSMLDGTSSTPPALRQHSMFSVHPTMQPPTLLNSSNYLTKSYSTLADPTSPSTTTLGPASSSTKQTPPAKILTRTQSADPRLNPPVSAPPPVTPKRKLSINEYRKRKQMSTGTEKSKAVVAKDKAVNDESGAFKETTSKINNLADSLNDLNSMPSNETKDTVFSPAPTLLEMQQENLSRRLKSYKSLQGLTSAIGCGRTETVIDNDDEINHRNMESTSKFSSSTSSLASLPSSKSSTHGDDLDGDEALKNINDSSSSDGSKLNISDETDGDAEITNASISISTACPLETATSSTSSTSICEDSGNISPSENTSR